VVGRGGHLKSTLCIEGLQKAPCIHPISCQKKAKGRQEYMGAASPLGEI